MSAIRFVQVTKKFAEPGPKHTAVDNISLDVEAGSFVVLLGPSGCGKTTLLKMVNRLHEPTSGTIFLGTDDITQLDKISLRRRIGYVIQQVGLFPHLTVAQNVAVVPELLGWPRPQIEARVAELLALVELPMAEYGARYPAQLSGGQQQRVGVARALAGDPEVMLMDEPFGAIDAITRTALQDELLYWQQRLHKTILFVTHDVEEALRLADNIVVMQAGEIVQVDTPLNLLRHPANEFVQQLLGGDDPLRLLRLVRLTAVMTPCPDVIIRQNQIRLPATASLHTALAWLLAQNEATAVVLVHDDPDNPASPCLGMVRLADIQQLLATEKKSERGQSPPA
jgi:osmoprotectant transport system ATP-binding protein